MVHISQLGSISMHLKANKKSLFSARQTFIITAEQ
jgi:hypothetical protein